MVNEVTLNASIQHVAPASHAAVTQQPSVKEVKEVKEVELTKGQGQAVSGKDVPQNHSSSQNEAESKVDMTEALQRFQDHVQNIERDLDFRVDEESGRTVVSVIDPETEEVVRQIPSEEILELIHHLEDGGGFLMKTEA